MFRPTLQDSFIATDNGTTVLLTLDARLGLLRRRRRVSFLKRLLVPIPVLMGSSLLLLAGLASIASTR